MTEALIIRQLDGLQDYQTIWQLMKDFNANRSPQTPDEFWFLEHSPVFTQGQAGKPEHVLNPHDIPIVQSDRGGQVTYHGPGQLVVYFLIDLRRKKLSIKQLVCGLEQAVINYLREEFKLDAKRLENAPGVYIEGSKICSLGLRIRKGCSYHGISFNIKMDLTPFDYINPCGLKNMHVVQLSDFDKDIEFSGVQPILLKYLMSVLGYTEIKA